MFSDGEACNKGMRTRARFVHSLHNVRCNPFSVGAEITDRLGWDRRGICSREDNPPSQKYELIHCHSSSLVLFVVLVLESMVLKPPPLAFESLHWT